MIQRKENTVVHPASAWIPLCNLVVNPAHQGGLHKGTLQKLTEKWAGTVTAGRLTLPGIVTVTPQAGTNDLQGAFEVLDGLHRLTVAYGLYSPNTLVLCHIVWDITDAEKSAEYLDINTQHSRSPFDKFRNAVTAGAVRPEYAKYTELSDALFDAGYVVADSGGSKNTLRCPVALMHAYDNVGPEGVVTAVQFLASAYPSDPDRFDGAMIQGVTQVLLWFPEIDLLALRRKMSKCPCSSILTSASSAAAVRAIPPPKPFTKTMAGWVAYGIVTLYDAKKQTGRLLPA